MVGPSSLSMAMGCPRRFRNLIMFVNSNTGENDFQRTSENDDHKNEGMLLESILQYIAVGENLTEQRSWAAIEERSEDVMDVLIELEEPGTRFSENHADLLKLSKKNAESLVGYQVSDFISKMRVCIGGFLDFIEDHALYDKEWQKEVTVRGVISTPFGDVISNGRIDLICNRESGPLVIEIKKRENTENSDTNQVLFYASLLNQPNTEVSVVNASSCSDPIMSEPVTFSFTSDEGDRYEASPKNCNSCYDKACPEFVLGH